MNADVQIKTYHPFRQRVEGDKIEFDVATETQSYIISDRGIENGTSLNPLPLVRDYIQPYEHTASQCEGKDIKPIFDLIQGQLQQIFIPEQEFERLVSALFILGTYTFQRFEAYPNLWLYTPRVHNQQMTETLFRNLCFNGITITSSFPSEAVTTCIESFHPTLIIQQYKGEKSNKTDPFYYAKNSKDSFIPTKDLKRIQLYCPKIMISYNLPNPQVGNHSLSLIANVINDSKPGSIDFKELRGRLCHNSIEIQEVLTKNLSCADTTDIFHPLRCLAKTLVEFNAISETQYDLIENELTQRVERIRQNEQFLFVNDVLQGISQFITLNKQAYPDGFIPLYEIVFFLRETDTIGTDYDERLLSRLINKFQLLQIKPKRKRNPNGIYTTPTISSPNATLYKQVTSVKINETKLKQLLSSDTIYFGKL